MWIVEYYMLYRRSRISFVFAGNGIRKNLLKRNKRNQEEAKNAKNRVTIFGRNFFNEHEGKNVFSVCIGCYRVEGSEIKTSYFNTELKLPK